MLHNGEILVDIGVSGDVLGDDSATDDESAVDTVVVGDESGDSEADVEVLSRGWWNV